MVQDFRNLEILRFSKQKSFLNLAFHLSQGQLFINRHMRYAFTGQFLTDFLFSKYLK